MTILRRSERALVRAMCGAKLMEKKRTEMLGLKESGSDGKRKHSEMVWACVEERWAYFEGSVGV